MNGQLDAVRDLYQTAKEDSEAVDVDAVLPYLDSDGSTERTIALRTLAVVASDDPGRMVDYLDDVRPALDDDVPAPKTVATFVFAFVAEEHPDEVVSTIPELVNLLDQEPPLLRFRAAGALSRLLVDHREAFVPHVDDLVDAFFEVDDVHVPDPDDPDASEELQERAASMLENREQEIEKDKARAAGTLEFAANAIVEVAEIDPDAVAPRVDDIADVLDADRPLVRTALVDTVATVAEHDAEAAEPAVDAVVDRLDDESQYVQAHAVRALGYAEATEAADDVRELADSDDVDPDVAELAADTADWLEEEA